ncbi:MAG: hypothetical protein IPK93_12230 [Solirubrobacterales bacterium]|nr:hypothetical protein [Solirubrobacterales bacterium]
MDFKKLGQQVGQLKKQAEDKLGDRADPEVLKKDGKELRNILSGDGSLAEKAKEAKEKMSDRGPGKAADRAQWGFSEAWAGGADSSASEVISMAPRAASASTSDASSAERA